MAFRLELVRELHELPGEPPTSEVVGMIITRDSAYRDEVEALLKLHLARQEAQFELWCARLERTLAKYDPQTAQQDSARENWLFEWWATMLGAAILGMMIALL